MNCKKLEDFAKFGKFRKTSKIGFWDTKKTGTLVPVVKITFAKSSTFLQNYNISEQTAHRISADSACGQYAAKCEAMKENPRKVT